MTEHDVPLPPASAVATPSPMAPDPRADRSHRRQAAQGRASDAAGRNTPAGAPADSRASSSWPRPPAPAVWDVNNALNFPNKHPLCLSMDKESLKHTDLVVGLDVKDWEKQLTELNNATRSVTPLLPANCDYVEIGFAELGISKWAMDYCRMQPCSVRAIGDTALGIPELIRICKERIAKDAEPPERRSPTARSRSASATTRSGPSGRRRRSKDWDASPITFPRLALGGVGRHQGRGLGAHRQRAQAAGAQALGLRQALPPSRASSSAPRRRSASRSAWRSRTATRGGSSSTSSPTAT